MEFELKFNYIQNNKTQIPKLNELNQLNFLNIINHIDWQFDDVYLKYLIIIIKK